MNTFPLNFGPDGQEMEDSVGLLVVNGVLMVELGSFQGYDGNGLLYTKFCAVLQRSRAKDDKLSIRDMTVVT